MRWRRQPARPQQRFQTDGGRHGAIAAGVGVQVIAAVICGPQPLGVGGIGHRRGEVDHAVELPGGADPAIDRLALGLCGRRPVASALKRGQGGAVDLDPLPMRQRDDPLVALDDLQRGDRHVRRAQGADALAVADVVDALQENHDADVGLLADVALKARHRVDATADGAVEHAVAADALVDDAERRTGAGGEPACQVVGPAGVGVHRRADPVGDGVSERHNGAGVAARRPHVDAGQEVPRVRLRGERRGGRVLGVTAAGDVADLAGLCVLGRGARRVRQVQAHRQMRARADRQADGV
jgi:hypothetical protein